MVEQIIPLAALMISAGTLMLGSVGMKRKTSADYTASLERRIDVVERLCKTLTDSVNECEHSRTELKAEVEELKERLKKPWQ